MAKRRRVKKSNTYFFIFNTYTVLVTRRTRIRFIFVQARGHEKLLNKFLDLIKKKKSSGKSTKILDVSRSGVSFSILSREKFRESYVGRKFRNRLMIYPVILGGENFR